MVDVFFNTLFGFLQEESKMISRPKRIYHRSGFSLVDIMLSITVVIIAVIGTSAYRYYAVLEARSSDIQVTAARVGLLFFESWRGTNGDETYDPTAHLGSDLTITEADGPSAPGGFDLLADYRVVLDDVDYYITLSWKDGDDDDDDDIQVGLRALNVVVAWSQRGQPMDGVEDTDKLFNLTGYAKN